MRDYFRGQTFTNAASDAGNAHHQVAGIEHGISDFLIWGSPANVDGSNVEDAWRASKQTFCPASAGAVTCERKNRALGKCDPGGRSAIRLQLFTGVGVTLR